MNQTVTLQQNKGGSQIVGMGKLDSQYQYKEYWKTSGMASVYSKQK